MPERLNTFFLLLPTVLLSLLLTACGAGKPSSSNETVNSFAASGSKPNNIQKSGVSGGTVCDTTAATNNNEFCVSVEANPAMVASNTSGQWIYNLLTPQKSYAYLGLNAVPVKNMEVVQLGVQMTTSSTASIPSYSFQITNTGVYRLIFSSAPTLRLDLAVKVTLKNNKILYAPLVSKNVAVNVVSNYQVTHFFNSLASSADLDNVIPCSNLTACTNQYSTKFILWGALTGFLQSYEVVIPVTDNLQDATLLLDQNGDFNNQILHFFKAIKQPGEFYVGTQASSNTTTSISTSSVTKEFNTVSYSFGFDNIYATNSTTNTSSFVSLISKTASVPIGNGQTSYDYPKLTLSEVSIGLNLKSLLPDLPVERQSLISNTDGSFSLHTDSELNSFTPQASSIFLGKDGFFTESRTPLQTVTNKASSTPYGWQYNPSFEGLYKGWEPDGTGTEALFSSFQSTGSMYTLAASSTSKISYIRRQLKESETFFNFIAHLRQTGDITSGSNNISKLSGKNWGVVSFSIKPHPSTSPSGGIPVLKATVSTYKWAISNSSIIQTQPTTADNHYETSVIQRMDNQNFVPSISSSDTSSKIRNLTALTNTEQGTSSGGTTLITQLVNYRGRFQLSATDGSTTPTSIGAYSKDGSALAVALNQSGTGRGFLQAIEMRTSTPVIAIDTTYQLQGNSLGFNSTKNIARDYGDSSLILHKDGSCVLNLRIREVKQDTLTNSVSTILDLNANPNSAATYNNLPCSYTLNQSEVQINIPNVEGSTTAPIPMILKGFIGKSYTANTDAPGNIMILSLAHGNHLGMLYGFKNQNLVVNP